MRIPKSFQQIALRGYDTLYPNDKIVKKSDILSETWGDYSYSRGTSEDGSQMSIEQIYSGELRRYCKVYDGLMFTEIKTI